MTSEKPLAEMTNAELTSAIRGKLLERNEGTVPFTLKMEQHGHSWSLLTIAQDGTVGVAAFGPIGSLGVILSILEKAGAKPHQVPNTQSLTKP